MRRAETRDEQRREAREEKRRASVAELSAAQREREPSAEACERTNVETSEQHRLKQALKSRQTSEWEMLGRTTSYTCTVEKILVLLEQVMAYLIELVFFEFYNIFQSSSRRHYWGIREYKTLDCCKLIKQNADQEPSTHTVY